MSQSEDINTLYRRFGGDASDYLEIVEADQAADAVQSWPLLAHLNSDAEKVIPGQGFAGLSFDAVDNGNKETSAATVPNLTEIEMPTHGKTNFSRDDEVPLRRVDEAPLALPIEDIHSEESQNIFSKHASSSVFCETALDAASPNGGGNLKQLFNRLSGSTPVGKVLESAHASGERSIKW